MEHLNLQTFNRKITLSSKGQLLILQQPLVMGILNLTPDSFYDGGRHQLESTALAQVEKMLKEGATIIDIGAYSSRPGAIDISENEELNRLIPIVELVHQTFPDCWISIDTFRSKVAQLAIEAGGWLINDISSGDDDPLMMETVARLNVPYIMMHKKGTPQNMATQANYQEVVLEVIQYFQGKIKMALQLGIKDVILDPGFGFSKTIAHNYTLLKQLTDLQLFELPILVGISRKSMLQKITNTNANSALNATSVANTIALLNGANILRVHDVKEALECINIVNATYGTFSTQ